MIHPDYHLAVSGVIRFVDEHLDEALTIERLAQVAGFSTFHFHRIFRGATGETLNAFVNRRRLERAARLLRFRSDLSVTEVALQVGFNSPEHFSRCFRKKFGFSAREYRAAEPGDPQSLRNRRLCEDDSEQSFYRVYEEGRREPGPQFSVELRVLPEFPVACITEVYGEDGTGLVAAYNELCSWAQENDVLNGDTVRFVVSRDDIEVTSAAQYRLQFCLSVPRGTPVSGRVESGMIAGGTYALIPVVGDIRAVAQAWDNLYRDWLPTGEFRPADAPAIEIFRKSPEEIGWENFDVEVGLPVIRQQRRRI